MDSIREPQELITSNIIKDLKDKKKWIKGSRLSCNVSCLKIKKNKLFPIVKDTPQTSQSEGIHCDLF